MDTFQNPFAQAAQEKYDTWICQNGTASQKRYVGTKNNSRVRCADVPPLAGDNNDPFSRPMIMTPGEAPPLNLPSRANQKANIFTKAFDPKKRKIIVLVIASFLIFLAFVNYD